MISLMPYRARLWDPWRDFSRLRDEMDRVLGSAPEGADYPLVNVSRLADRVVVEALVPGADRSTLDVSTVGNTLTIRGERKREPNVETRAYHRREREDGHFVRTLRLDGRVGAENVAATYRDGILRIELPYGPEAQPRRVVIQG
jgi:HSP20 family protein